MTVNGKPAVVEFISPSQVNIQPPDDSALGPVQVVVTMAAGASNSFTANYATFAPGLFPATSPYIVAQHADNGRGPVGCRRFRGGRRRRAGADQRTCAIEHQ